MNTAEALRQDPRHIREQFRIAEANFSAGIMGSWQQEVEQIRNRTKADLAENRLFG